MFNHQVQQPIATEVISFKPYFCVDYDSPCGPEDRTHAYGMAAWNTEHFFFQDSCGGDRGPRKDGKRPRRRQQMVAVRTKHALLGLWYSMADHRRPILNAAVWSGAVGDIGAWKPNISLNWLLVDVLRKGSYCWAIWLGSCVPSQHGLFVNCPVRSTGIIPCSFSQLPRTEFDLKPRPLLIFEHLQHQTWPQWMDLP